jgi:GMP synthase-like glutamine amidotransferase
LLPSTLISAFPFASALTAMSAAPAQQGSDTRSRQATLVAIPFFFDVVKPVAICRFAPHEGPGYFGAYLTAHSIPWRVVKLDEREMLPAAGAISGLAMMGGAMSVNDDLPWIAPVLELVRRSIASEVPVIGHCLGGQLLAKALGADVKSNPVKEIGWGDVHVVDARLAADWGAPATFLSYHWHGETFSMPSGAVRIWSSAHCENQAFVYGNSIGMQCHIEMTKDMIEAWCATGVQEIEESIGRSPAVQSPAAMLEDVTAKLKRLHGVADRVYGRWLRGLERD